ncbi:MAG: hypothetical protein IPP88_22465 [Betaproteobacteria bacterium]|nr:hypothetical protein [Betaproteobacteria bacterium]
MSDMPASSGLGSSSTFAVGLLNLIAHFERRKVTKLDLALREIHLERNLSRKTWGFRTSCMPHLAALTASISMARTTASHR